MAKRRKMTRREFLRTSVLVAAGAVSACASPTASTEEATTEPEEKVEATPKPAAESKEAPMLRELVEAGELPPVEERLPVDALIIEPVEEIGEYGGTWHRAAVGPGDRKMDSKLTYEGLTRWNGPTDVSGVKPNIAKSWDINEDATEFTFHLRRGMRWSDGEPFTADDWVFWYENVLKNKDLTPVFPSALTDPTEREPMKLERIDDYTFKITFNSSYGLFLRQTAYISRGWGGEFPKHYMQQFHPDYVDEAELAEKVEEAGYDNWWELWGKRGDKYSLEKPRLWAWLPKQMPPDSPLIDERNPYYWKVDPEGNQLPYIDRIQHDVVEDGEVLNMMAVAGDIDMQARNILQANYPLFVENAEKGDYRVLMWMQAKVEPELGLNYNHNDAGLRELFQNRDFRIALSLGIDREAMNQTVYGGLGEPRQIAPTEECPYYKPEYGTRYIEYDPDRANEILDKIGLTERDEEGYRKRLDGERLSIVLETDTRRDPAEGEAIALDWQKIDIRATLEVLGRPVHNERVAEGHEFHISLWTGDRLATPTLEPTRFMPSVAGGGHGGARDWYDWYLTAGEGGEEPPPLVKRQYELVDLIKGAPSEEKRREYAEEFFDTASEQLYYIGCVGNLPALAVVKNNFRNVPEEAISDWMQQEPGNCAPEHFFIRKG